ncbi:MAG: BspA family leucine-rich repeat surface protein [Bacteroidales bacterium]|nr:BspA family leucine-rich repeat surface protein [Bacteroidales bacterium]MBO7617375.1 BspA family leucine-rich repeat surface protein [Bacteroidales bacterium]
MADAETGRFKMQPDNVEMESMNSAIIAQRGYTEAISRLQAQINGLQKAVGGMMDEKIESGLSFTEGVFKKDFLPEHEKSYFCRSVELTYSGIYDTETADTIVVNGLTINLGVTHTIGVVETTVLKIANENGTMRVRCNDTIVSEFSDTIILTVVVNAPNISDGSVNVDYVYGFVDYSDVDVKSKNGFPITEKYEGEIEYWNRMCEKKPYQLEQYTHALASHHSLAVYSIGDYSGTGDILFRATFYNETKVVPPTNVIRYIYMANWSFERITSYGQMFSVNNSTNVRDVPANSWIYDAFCKKLDFSKVTFGKISQTGSTIQRLVEEYRGDSLGSLKKFGDAWRVDFPLSESNKRSELSKMWFVHSIGDISDWDVSKVADFREQFSGDYRLEFVGDIGKWNITSVCVNLKNFFRGTLSMRGISSSIMNWDTQNVTALNGTFLSTLNIGDNTLYGLGRWNVGKCTNFRFTFAYLSPSEDRLTDAELNEIRFDSDTDKIYRNKNVIYAGTLPPEEITALELENIELIGRVINDRKTNLSFVEDWDMSSAARLEEMFAWNPYLVNLGDLRKWSLTASADMESVGFIGFLKYCTALETFYMPSIPRGTNVTDICKGCFALANIVVDELNVEAISFADCPLTKQSVLNLVNAATADTEITLKPSVYEAYAQDSDVVAALAAKAGDSINVSLTTTE